MTRAPRAYAMTETMGAIAWDAESLRMTAFLAQPLPAPGLDGLWQALLQEAPELVTASPRAGTKQLEGPLKLGRLMMLEQPSRVDLLRTAQNAIQAALAADEAMAIGPLSETVADFSPMAAKWLSALGAPVTRLALGAVLSGKAAENRSVAYHELQQYLPSVRLDPESSSEFSYQINRPRQSRVSPGLSLNRIMKW